MQAWTIYYVLPVLIAVGAVAWIVQRTASRRLRAPFSERPFLSPEEQLRLAKTEAPAEKIEAAVPTWNDIARTFGLEPAKLRASDSLAQLAATDFLGGDRFIDIEARLRHVGMPAPAADTTFCDLVWSMSEKVK